MTVIHREKKITFKLAADAQEPYYKHAVHKKKGRATNKPRRRVTRARTTPTSTGGGQPVAPAATGLSPESMGKVTGMAVTILATLDDQEIAALIQTLDWLTKQGAIT
jgi:hypothetical protein